MSQNLEGTLRVGNNIFFKEVKEILSSGKDVLFTINGNSMRPFLSHGDKVLISPHNYNDLKIGKIILAKSKFGYVLHRLVWKNNTKIWLVGDNNLVQIEEIEIKDILGFVKYAESNKERINVQSFVHITLSMLWFIIRPLRLFIYKIKVLLRLK
jgi:signal peptidase